MRKMKKVVSLVAAAVMVFALAVPVNAATSCEAQYNGEPYATFELALSKANEDGGTIELLTDVTVEGIQYINNSVTIDGNGKTITTTANRTFRINDGNKLTEKINVTFKDVTLYSAVGAGRLIETRGGNIDLTLDGVKLETTSTGNNQPFTVGGNHEKAIDVTIKNSEINAGVAGYGIITFNPVNLTLENTELVAYGGLYFREPSNSAGSSGTVVNVINSSVSETTNIHSGATNAFGNIVFEDDNIKVNVDNSSIIAKATGDQPQFVIKDTASEGSDTPNTVNFFNGAEIIADSADTFINGDVSTVVVVKDATSNIEIPAKYIADGYAIKAVDDGYEVACAHKTVKAEGAKAATCTEAGYTGDKVCNTCGETLEKGKAIEATGHTYVNGACACGDKIEVKVETEVVDTITKEEVKVEEVKEVTVVEDENTVKAEISVKAETTVIATEVATADDVKETDAVKTGVITEATAEAVKEAVLAGDTVKTEIVVNEVKTELVPTSAQTNIEKAAATVGKNAEVVQYLDVSVVLKAANTGKELGTVDKLATPIKVTVAIPENLKADNVKYVVIRDHNGTITKLPTTLNANGTITFETDMFSTYALAVADADTTAPKTGDTGMMPAAWVAIIAAAGIAFVAARRRSVVR